MPKPTLVRAYTDKPSYPAGSELTLFAAGPGGSIDVDLYRLTTPVGIDGSAPELGTPIRWTASNRYDLTEQESCVGSFLVVPTLSTEHRIEAFSIGAWVWCPQWADEDFQSLISVGLDDDRYLALGVRGGMASSVTVTAGGLETILSGSHALTPNTWNLLTLSASDGVLHMRSAPAHRLYGAPETVSGSLAHVALDPDKPLTVAGVAGRIKSNKGVAVSGTAEHLLTAKVGDPFLSAGTISADDLDALVSGGDVNAVLAGRILGAWDLAPNIGKPSSVAFSRMATPDAILVNMPLRGVTGPTWDGTEHDFRHAPEQYNAVHFHDTDIADVDWDPTFTARLPQNLSSGLYGIRIDGPGGTDLVPVIVTPAPEVPRKRIALILPTFTQLAYANETIFDLFEDLDMTDKPGEVTERDAIRAGDRAYGLSMYETHKDASGVAISSAARPIVNYRPHDLYWLTGCPRHVAADLWIIKWLHELGHEFDILSDLDVHLGGIDTLAQYDVVVTGGHPEYITSEILDALTEYRDNGGGLMYLGGNGFYWVTGVLSIDPLVIEIRRGEAGIRAWQSQPGEEHLWSTGLKAGMWRQNGRNPQRLVGVGMCAQGWGRSEPYAINPAISPGHWLLDGIEESTIGVTGRSMGGAAGDELDRVDYGLGTPPNTQIIASSRGHTDYYQRVVEEIPVLTKGTQGGTNDPEIHSDIVWFEVPDGGAVFSVGSIAYSGSLLDDAGISRLTQNALERLLQRAKSQASPIPTAEVYR